jgi:hypothetical protein
MRLTQTFQRFAVIALLGFLNSSCSSPAVPEETQQQAYDNALASYDNCSSIRRPVGLAGYCNNIAGSGGARSYSDYIYGQENNVRTLSQNDAPQSELESASLRAAYAAYLATLTPEQLNELAAKWRN